MKTALVTGHRGFIGRHMTAALQSAGYEVRGVDSRLAATGLEGVAVAEDARDFFRRIDGRPDVVIHAAAVVGGRALIDGAPLALAVNLELDAAMFAWAERTRPGRVIYLSSSAAYPVTLQRTPRKLRETDLSLTQPGLPDQLYGWCKLTGEQLAARARAAGVAVSVVRPFSGYAGDQGDDYPFMALAGRVAHRQDPLPVWGSGRQVRDFIHADDLCAAIMTMISQGIDGPVNLGTGRPLKLAALARMMARAAGYDPQVVPVPGSPQGVAYRCADTTLMRTFFDPKVTVEDGIARALEAVTP